MDPFQDAARNTRQTPLVQEQDRGVANLYDIAVCPHLRHVGTGPLSHRQQDAILFRQGGHDGVPCLLPCRITA